MKTKPQLGKGWLYNTCDNPTVCIVLGDERFCCSCLAIETNSIKLSIKCYWANMKAESFLEVCNCWLQKGHELCALLTICWPHFVILFDPPLHDHNAVISDHVHFVISSLTVDCGFPRREEISQLNILSWYNAGIYWTVSRGGKLFLILYPWSRETDWVNSTQLFRAVTQYFWQYSQGFFVSIVITK